MAFSLHALSLSQQNSVGFSDTNTVSLSSSNTQPTAHSQTLSLLDFFFQSKAFTAHTHSQSQPLQWSNLFKNTFSNQWIKYRGHTSKIYELSCKHTKYGPPHTGGTTLSVWDMQKIKEANRQEEEAPMCVNITDIMYTERSFPTHFLS